MSHFKKLLALLLALAWLPATMHCLAEEMGVPSAVEHSCSQADTGSAPADPDHHASCQACVTFERALVKAQLATVAAVPPTEREDALAAALLALLARPVAEFPPALEDSPPPLAERFSRTVSLLI